MPIPASKPIAPDTGKASKDLPLRDMDFARAAKELTERFAAVREVITALDEAGNVSHKVLDMEVSI